MWHEISVGVLSGVECRQLRLRALMVLHVVHGCSKDLQD